MNSQDGHALAMDERLVAYSPGPRWLRGHGGYAALFAFQKV